VGTYRVTVSLTGFKEVSQTGVVLSANQTMRADAVLEIGAVSERIEVVANAAALKTESTEVSATMERKLVEDLPVAAAGVGGGGMRNVFNLMLMLPQVSSTSGDTSWKEDLRFGGGQSMDFSINVDGLPVEVGWRNMLSYQARLVPNIDSVQEFRLPRKPNPAASPAGHSAS
jgi:hypothetical protein